MQKLRTGLLAAPRIQAAIFWGSLALLGALLYWQLTSRLDRSLRTLVLDSNDVNLYREAGEALLRGELPYRDFFIEYPPGGIPTFIMPALFSSELADFGALFGAEMALLLVISLILVAVSAKKLHGEWDWFTPTLTFAAGALLLQPVAVSRFDPLVSLTLAAAVLCAALGGRYLILAYASLGFGAAAKLIPFLATFPLAMLKGREEPLIPWLRKTAWGFLALFTVLGLFFVPAYLLGYERFIESFNYHAERGLQIESLGAAVLMKLGLVQDVVFRYGAMEVEGSGAQLLSSLSIPISAALLLVTGFVMYRDYRIQRFAAAKFPRYAAAFILAFMVGSKVLSPQYMLWLLPLIPLAASGLWGVAASALFLITCWTTTEIFPYQYGSLMDLEPDAVDLLLLRDLLLVMLWAMMLILPSEKTPEKEPA